MKTIVNNQQSMQKLIPYGLANFRDIIEENYYYVDKTHYIPLLEQVKTPVFLRPRRFGKSLFTETLRWYYDIRASHLFDSLFGQLYIGKNPTPLKNSFYFLAMDLSGMSDYSESDKGYIHRNFTLTIIGYIVDFLRTYREELDIDEDFIAGFKEEYRENSGEALKSAVQLVQQKEGKVYLVIDEYDALTNAMAINYIHAKDEDNEYLNITRKGGFFRSFFESIKGSMKIGLSRVFITGILPITISDMNSGFNIAQWISHEEEFINMLGLTEDELSGLMKEIYQNNPQIDLPVKEVKSFLKRYYNGYHFSKEAEPVYNPMMALSCLRTIIKSNCYPRLPADQNIRVQYDQVAYIFGKNNTSRDAIIKEITDTKAYKFNIHIGRQFNMKDYKSGRFIPDCLYYLGLLTHGKRYSEFVVPNLVTYEMILSYFEEIMDFSVEGVGYDRMVIEFMETGNMEDFVQSFFAAIIQKFPGDFFKDVNESFYRGLFFHILYSFLPNDLYDVFPEFNLPGGTVDLYINHRNLPDELVGLQDLIEIKRVKKSATDAELKARLQEAEDQVIRYRTGDYSDFRAVALCFRGNKDYQLKIL
ncbi:MAG: hypothetical protein D3924_01305 [Candidatus Electrothrix sp. AR4]|nr:hypothetical protein [Candidatus Electrothrix sp. AR4]